MLTYSTRGNSRIDKIIDRAGKLKVKIEKIEKGEIEKIREKEKLSLGDLGTLNNLSQMSFKVFDPMNDEDLAIISPDAINFKKSIRATCELIEFFKEQLEKDSKELTPGLIQLHHAPSKKAFTHKKLGVLSKLTSAFSGNYVHAGVISRHDEYKAPTTYESPAVGSPVSNSWPNFKDVAYSHFYRVDASKLGNKKISKEQKTTLNTLYKEVALKTHQEMRKGSKIQNPYYNSYQSLKESGMSEWSWVNKFAFKKIFPSPWKAKKQELDKLAEKFVNHTLNPEVTENSAKCLACSAFTSMATLATLVNLQKKIGTKPENYGLPKNFKIKLPFSSYRDFEKISPSKLQNLLSRKGCLVKRPPPKIMQSLIKRSSLKRMGHI